MGDCEAGALRAVPAWRRRAAGTTSVRSEMLSDGSASRKRSLLRRGRCRRFFLETQTVPAQRCRRPGSALQIGITPAGARLFSARRGGVFSLAGHRSPPRRSGTGSLERLSAPFPGGGVDAAPSARAPDSFPWRPRPARCLCQVSVETTRQLNAHWEFFPFLRQTFRRHVGDSIRRGEGDLRNLHGPLRPHAPQKKRLAAHRTVRRPLMSG